jgi:hypothetical protein
MTDQAQVVRLALRRAAGRTSAAVAVRVEGEPCGAGVFLVPSRSVPGDTYGLTLRGDGTLVCPCPSFHHRARCRHADAVALAVEIENQQAAPRRLPPRDEDAWLDEQDKAASARRLAEIEREFAR